jgi:hypothetical protein
MEYIKQIMFRNKGRIAAASVPNAELTYCMYEEIRDYILAILEERFLLKGKIAILGGVQINVADADDYFEPHMFYIIDSVNGRVDFLD